MTAEYGWTKAAIGKMRKLDSFLRESQRYNGISLSKGVCHLLGVHNVDKMSLSSPVFPARKAMKDLTFIDGTVIPAGTMVNVNAHRLHLDDAYYPDADVFDPFRYSRIREVEGEGTKHQFVNTSNHYVAFGVGRHAW